MQINYENVYICPFTYILNERLEGKIHYFGLACTSLSPLVATFHEILFHRSISWLQVLQSSYFLVLMFFKDFNDILIFNQINEIRVIVF